MKSYNEIGEGVEAIGLNWLLRVVLGGWGGRGGGIVVGIASLSWPSSLPQSSPIPLSTSI